MMLNPREQNAYAQVKNTITNLPPGVYYARDFFPNEPTCPRVVKELYKEVSVGIIPRVNLVGTTSAEGYIVT